MYDWQDILTRCAWTFAQAFAAALIVVPTSEWDEKALTMAALAGIAAVLSLVKGLAVARFGK